MIDLVRKQQILAALRYLSKHLDQTLMGLPEVTLEWLDKTVGIFLPE